MKKNIIVILTITLVMILSACSANTFKSDKIPAVAEITTSENGAYVISSVNGTGTLVNGVTYAVNDHPCQLVISDGEEATIHFTCPACGYEIEETFTAPFAKLYQCECPLEIDSNGNAREYISLTTKAE